MLKEPREALTRSAVAVAPVGTPVASSSFWTRATRTGLFMSKSDNEEVARLEKLNDDLKKSLQRCREMLHTSEARLAANSNEPDSPVGGQEHAEA